MAGRKIRAPLCTSLGRSVSISVAVGRKAGAVATSSITEAVEKLRKTSLSNAESTEDRLADTAVGSLKSTGDGASLPHATIAATPSTTPARRNNRIQPPKRNCGANLKSACAAAGGAVTSRTPGQARRSRHRRATDH